MRNREELAVSIAEPLGQRPDTASGGRGHCDAPVLSASAPIRRKAVRRATVVVKSKTEMPDASVSVGPVEGEPQVQHANSGSGLKNSDTLSMRAAPDDIAGQCSYVSHGVSAGSGIDHMAPAFQVRSVNPATIAAIQSLHREHRAIQRARGDMERRIKADERWFAVRRYRAEGIPLPDGKFPETTKADQAMVIATRQRFFTIRDQIEEQRKQCQKELLALVKPLPVMKWVAGVKGLGLPSVAAIIGEAGDLANYSNPGKLWKRMGLAVFDGKAQGKRSDAAEALRHGYNPARRSEMHVVGDCLVRAGGPYADLYRARKAAEMEREGVTKMHAHKRALRYIEKRLLREMWQAWRGAIIAVQTEVGMSPAEELAGPVAVANQTRVASQDGNQSKNETLNASVPVLPIPRKRVPRTRGCAMSKGQLSGANT